MIYVTAIAILIASVGFYRRSRDRGIWIALIDGLIAIAAGWIAGLLIGIGARIGMASIPYFNGTVPSFSLDGSLNVVLVFSSAGIGLGLLYELVFRHVFAQRGWLFGVFVILCVWYPVASAGLQQIKSDPPFISVLFMTGSIVAIMFLPFALALEFLLAQGHKISQPLSRNWLVKG